MKVTVSNAPNPSIPLTILPYHDKCSKDVLKLYSATYRKDIASFFTSSEDEVFVLSRMAKGQASHLVLFNIAKAKPWSNPWLKLAVDHASIFSSKIQIDLRDPEVADQVVGVAQGLELATYDLALYKKERQKPHPLAHNGAVRLIVDNIERKRTRESFLEAQVITQHQKNIMDLVNAPGNKANPPYLEAWTRSMSEKHGFSVKILQKKQIERKGLDALLAVNRGSEWDPIFIIATYQGSRSRKAKTLGLVGKGVTFDTGGLSIKPSNNMHYMKSDMGGAAAVLGTMAAVAQLQWPVNLVAVVPVTDNCVDATAIKPGDVIGSYSGKTIEVLNTDAEGRLILADALAYLAKHHEVDHVIDLATLTGSCVATFGSVCAGLMSNDEELADDLVSSGLQSGERVWQLPLWQEHREEMDSDIADIKNLPTRPVAGAITAAAFLQAFIGDHPSWAHLDIAGVAFGETKYSKSKAATGYGVQLLTRYIKDHLLL